MTSGRPGTDQITDFFDDSCYPITKPSSVEVIQHHLTLNIDHQRQTDDFTLLAVMMTEQIANCSMMNIFHVLHAGPDECDWHDRCVATNDSPGAHYGNTDLVTCSFHCTCADTGNQCAVVAQSFTWDDDGWELCEVVLQT